MNSLETITDEFESNEEEIKDVRIVWKDNSSNSYVADMVEITPQGMILYNDNLMTIINPSQSRTIEVENRVGLAH